MAIPTGVLGMDRGFFSLPLFSSLDGETERGIDKQRSLHF